MNRRISKVVAQKPYTVELSFTDGSRGTVDLGPWIRGSRGVFAALQDPSFFGLVSVDSEAGTIVWPNGADLDPDVLYEAARASTASPRQPRRRLNLTSISPPRARITSRVMT